MAQSGPPGVGDARLSSSFYELFIRWIRKTNPQGFKKMFHPLCQGKPTLQELQYFKFVWEFLWRINLLEVYCGITVTQAFW